MTQPTILVSMNTNILGSSFEKVKKFKGASMVMFGSSWSVPSQLILERLKGKSDGLVLSYVDTDVDPYQADRLDVISLPCFVFFVNGEEVRRVLGAVSVDELLEEFVILKNEFNDLEEGGR